MKKTLDTAVSVGYGVFRWIEGDASLAWCKAVPDHAAMVAAMTAFDEHLDAYVFWKDLMHCEAVTDMKKKYSAADLVPEFAGRAEKMTGLCSTMLPHAKVLKAILAARA